MLGRRASAENDLIERKKEIEKMGEKTTIYRVFEFQIAHQQTFLSDYFTSDWYYNEHSKLDARFTSMER